MTRTPLDSPTYSLTHPDGSTEPLETDGARVEGIHTVLRGTAFVIGLSRGGGGAAGAVTTSAWRLWTSTRIDNARSVGTKHVRRGASLLR